MNQIEKQNQKQEGTEGTELFHSPLFPLLPPVHKLSRGFALFAAGLFCMPCQAAEPLRIDSVVLRPMVEAEVPARQTGVLAKIDVDEGGLVKEGDLLAALDDRAAKLALQKADLERQQAAAKASNDLRVQYADKALEVARAEMKRSSESNAQFAKSISQSQLDVERLTVDKLQLERRQAEQDQTLDRFDLQLKENALQSAKLDVELHAVRAPFTGVVALVRGRIGEWVQPGTPVLRLVAVERLRAEGFAPAEAVNSSMLGAAVRFSLSTKPDSHEAGYFEGPLRFISPEIDPVSKQVRVWAEIDNRELKLRPGQQGQLLFPGKEEAANHANRGK
jgi:macrolide-specific efflux system membrane fusion protein